MEILYFNSLWMLWNAFLALLPIGFAFLYFRTSRRFYKVILGVCWFLFLPNSLYVISDIEHIIAQWPLVGPVERLFLLIQYIHLEVIGLTAFIFGMFVFEKEMQRVLKKKQHKFIVPSLIVLNFLIGFAMVIGKVERVNSWDVFTATDMVIESMLNVLQSPQLMALSILFAIFGNLFYFLFRDPVVKYARRQLKEG